MKLRKLLLLGLLGICVPLTGCGDDENEPANDPASEEVPHHPTSNFDRCPLLAHIDNPKLGIKEITEERYLNGKLLNDSRIVYLYDKEQRLIKSTGINEDGAHWTETCEYDAEGRPVQYMVTNDQGAKETHTFVYDAYGFLVKVVENRSYAGGEGGESEMAFSYVGDTLILAETWEDRTTLSKVLYSADLYPLYFGGGSGSEFIYEWKDGNLMAEKSRWDADRDWNEKKYEYDANVSIGHLTTWCIYMWFVENVGGMCKNNRLGSWSYTYTDKGMVATQQSSDGNWSYKYTYLYY